MPETYDGTEGTAAAAAGYSVLDGGEQWRTGWRAINKTRDMLAALKSSISAVWPVLKGGTGATTAAGARTNLGLDQTVADVAGATPALGGNTLVKRTADNRFNVGTPTGADNATPKSYVDDVSLRNGGTINGGLVVTSNAQVNGDIRTPNATPATSGYTIAYIDGPDGRISKGASSERYKSNIKPVDPLELGDVFGTLYEYTLRLDGDSTVRFGDIAERLAESPALERFVVYDAEGLPDSIDFLALLRVQTAVLHAEVAQLRAEVAQLRGGDA